jgi:ribosomal-protein-alanine N-acetyltransferase
MPEVLIRKMAHRDLDDVVAIEDKVFTDPWSYNSFKSDIYNDMAHPVVAVFDEEVIGYACIYIVAGEVQIGNIAVAPEFRKRGVAKMLMNEILKMTDEHNCDSIFLEVRESNKAAQELYYSYGFKVVARRDAYYRNPRENAIIMVKEL